MEQKDPKGRPDTPDGPSRSSDRGNHAAHGGGSTRDEMSSTARPSQMWDDLLSRPLPPPPPGRSTAAIYDTSLRSGPVQGESGASGFLDSQRERRQGSSTRSMPPNTANFGHPTQSHNLFSSEEAEAMDYTAGNLVGLWNRGSSNEQAGSSQRGGDVHPAPGRPHTRQQSFSRDLLSFMRSATGASSQGSQQQSSDPLSPSPPGNLNRSMPGLPTTFGSNRTRPKQPQAATTLPLPGPPHPSSLHTLNFPGEPGDYNMRSGLVPPQQQSSQQSTRQASQPYFQPPFAGYQSLQLASPSLALTASQAGPSRTQRSTPTSSPLGPSRKKSPKSSPRYGCQLCPMRFGRPSNLAVHLRVHSGEKPFICDQCSKAFSTSSNMKRHKRKLHKELYTEEELASYGRQRRPHTANYTIPHERQTSDETMEQMDEGWYMELGMESLENGSHRVVRRDGSISGVRDGERESDDETTERSQTHTISPERADRSQLAGEAEPLENDEGGDNDEMGKGARDTQPRPPRRSDRGHQ